jgi:chaperonin GroES
MIIQPTNDNIILRLPEIKREQKTASGILIVKDGTQQSLRTDIAEVIAVGEGRRLNDGTLLPMSVKIEDRVIFNKYAGTEIATEDGKFLILKETDILAIVQ